MIKKQEAGAPGDDQWRDDEGVPRHDQDTEVHRDGGGVHPRGWAGGGAHLLASPPGRSPSGGASSGRRASRSPCWRVKAQAVASARGGRHPSTGGGRRAVSTGHQRLEAGGRAADESMAAGARGRGQAIVEGLPVGDTAAAIPSCPSASATACFDLDYVLRSKSNHVRVVFGWGRTVRGPKQEAVVSDGLRASLSSFSARTGQYSQIKYQLV